MKYNDDDRNSHLPDIFRKDSGGDALQRLTADIGRDETMRRRIDFGERDPFGLLEIQDTYEDMAEDLFVACEGITKACAGADKNTKKAFLRDDSLELPHIQVSKRHIYQLRRGIIGDSVVYTYQRAGKGYVNAGFQIVRNEAGHTILKSLDPEQTPIDDDEEYLKLIVMARRYINEYASGLSIPLESLEAYARREIIRDKLSRKIGKAALNTAVLVGNTARNGAHHARYAALAAIVLAPIPGYSTPLYHGAPILKPVLMEAGDDLVHVGSHKRQGYDAKGYHLPENAPIVNNGQTVKLSASPLTPLLLKQLEGAPGLSANAEDKQDLYGGPRHLTHLGVTRESNKRKDYDLDPGEYEDIVVGIDPEDGLRVMGITGNSSDALEMTVSNKEIKIRNVSDRAITEEDMKTIYVEVVDRKA